MSTIRELLRDVPPFDRPYALAATPVRTLHIQADGERCVLPWAQFHGAFQKGGSGDGQLLINFTRFEVEAQGVGLDALVPLIWEMRLTSLRGMPKELRGNFKSGTFIERVCVKPVDSKDAMIGQAETLAEEGPIGVLPLI